MDDNSLSSDSVCSDDTEYLLGQNVSIREIDDFDLKPSPRFEQVDKISSLKLKEGRQSPRLENGTKKMQYDPVTARKDGKKTYGQGSQNVLNSDMLVYPERGKESVKHSAAKNVVYTKHACVEHSTKEQEKFTEAGNTPKREKKNDLRKQPERKTILQSGTQHTKTETHYFEEGRGKESMLNGSAKQKKKNHKSKTKQRQNYEDKTVDLTRKSHNKDKTEPEYDQRKGWRQKSSPSNFENSWNLNNKDSLNEDNKFDSPEQADVGSMTSEATEDLLKGDELDGSIIEKLKELNLAVNYDPESQELYDDKVREGAQLLSKLFGGNVDNYYSSPSVHSGSASGQESSRGESQIEEKRNISISSSKGSITSFINAENLPQQTPEETKKPIQRKAKVSFATDDSTSFDCSPRVTKKQADRSYDEKYSQPLKQDTRYSQKKDGYGGFVRETSALRAAMDYDDDEDDDDDDDEDKVRREPSTENYREAESNVIRDYQKQKQQQQQHSSRVYLQEDQDDPSNSTGKTPIRYKIERYSDSDQRRAQGQGGVDSEPQWDGFYTSTPHRNVQQVVSPGTNVKVDTLDIERKLYLEKKLQETEDKLNQSSKDLLEIKSEVDKVLTKKKIVLEETQVLVDKLKRTKADIKTSENLAEQYRQQVTKTRSELMDLEVERDSARQDIKDMENLLIKQKQEANEAFKVERKNERKVLELSLDNNKLQREIETFKTKLDQSESTFISEKKLLQEKVELLQEQFRDGQRAAEENIKRLKKQLEDERQSARCSHYERINSIQKFQDESKEIQEKEIEAVKTHLTRESEVQMEKLQEKSKREIDALSRSIKDGEGRISQLENTLREKEDEVDNLKTKLLEEQQKAYENETTLKEEMTKLEAYVKALKAEVDSLRQRESNLSASNRTLEQSYDEKLQETRRLQDKIQNQLEESNKLQENKEDEIVMLRSLVRQQEDATRLLGEKMRTEAQEQIRSALQRERETIDKEREKQKEKLTEIKDSYEDILKQVRAELEEERKTHHQLQTAALKMKKEIDKLRERNLVAQEEKVNVVTQMRSETKEQIIRLKDKIQEIALVTDRNEKDIVLEINEECRRVAAVIGGSPNTTPIKSNSLSSSFTGSITGRESPGSNTNSPAREALANLKSCNAELRQHLIESRRELEYQKNESSRKLVIDSSSSP